jgi:hypothetical protein
METIIILSKVWILSWFITRFEPLTMLLDELPNRLLYNLLRLLLSCLKCVSFWATLLWTGNIFLASGIAFISFWYDKWIGPLERKVRL